MAWGENPSRCRPLHSILHLLVLEQVAGQPCGVSTIKKRFSDNPLSFHRWAFVITWKLPYKFEDTFIQWPDFSVNFKQCFQSKTLSNACMFEEHYRTYYIYCSPTWFIDRNYLISCTQTLSGTCICYFWNSCPALRNSYVRKFTCISFRWIPAINEWCFVYF